MILWLRETLFLPRVSLFTAIALALVVWAGLGFWVSLLVLLIAVIIASILEP